MKKIIVEKEEGIAEVIDRILNEPDDEIALVVPKGSSLGRSVSNFHLLKREADTAGKAVTIESVDDTILAFAKQSDLESVHPLWRGVQGSGGIADILPADQEVHELIEDEPVRKKHIGKKVPPVKLTVPVEEAVTLTVEDEDTGEKYHEPYEEEEEEAESFLSRIPRKFIWGGVAVIAAIAIVLGIITWSFGHVAIAINFKQTPWTFTGAFLADKSVSTPNAANQVIPGQVFSTQKNMTQSFPASGSANVSLKAQGTVTIYNAYSSAPQQLVATTRFVTPDGKLFHIVNNVTVPGASVTNGQIVPSSIDTAAVADQVGPAYNVGATQKLTIPGLQGSPKYDAFYGTLKNGASGGFVGTKAVPTAADITNAKAKVTAALQANLQSDLTTSYPNNFKILDGATSVQVTKLTVNTTTDAGGNFSLFGEAALQAIGFDESAFKAVLLAGAQGGKANSIFKTITLNYSNVKADFTKGRLNFSVSATGLLEPAFSVDDFKDSIAGKSIGDARATIAGLPDLSDGKISVWPMWLWSVPGNPNKVQVNAN